MRFIECSTTAFIAQTFGDYFEYKERFHLLKKLGFNFEVDKKAKCKPVIPRPLGTV